MDEDQEFFYATDTDWDRAEARFLGMQEPNRAWISTDRDVWHKNPFYHGPPVPHPEDDSYEEDDFIGPRRPYVRSLDDEIPF